MKNFLFVSQKTSIQTIRGIYYDLNDSTYTLKVEGLTFYFSSEFYRMKFAESFVKYIESET